MSPSKPDPYYPPPPAAEPAADAKAYYAPTTGVPVTPTGTLQIQSQAPMVPWSTGLFDCFDDPTNCFITWCCPCITFGQIAEIIDRGSTSCGASGALYLLIAWVTGCPCFYSCFYRSKIRAQYGLPEEPCADCLLHCCCEACSLCQMYRELKRRGFDMTIGWQANMERQAAAQTPAMPPPPQSMIR